MVLLLPDGVEVAIDGLGPLLGLAHLHSDVGVTGARLVFGLQSLGTHNCRGEKDHQKRGESDDEVHCL